MDEKEMEEKLRRAFYIDKLLPSVGLKRLTASLGNKIVLPDGRPLAEIIAERRACERPTTEDLRLWEAAMFEWLPLLDIETRTVVRQRCCGMGWKRLAFEMHSSVRTIQRRFKNGLDCIIQFLNKSEKAKKK